MKSSGNRLLFRTVYSKEPEETRIESGLIRGSPVLSGVCPSVRSMCDFHG